MPHKGYLNKIFNTHVALPHILLETIITCKTNHMQENEKSKQKKEKCTKQCNHKYEICLMEMILKELVPNSHISNV